MRICSGLRQLTAVAMLMLAGGAFAQCRDSVVLVHGNTGSPSDFNNTVSELQRRGYAASQIHRPAWGSRSCAACNDHYGSEEAPVLDAMIEAIAGSCTGRVDVIGHSMGVTLAGRVIKRNGLRGYVQSFVGVAGAVRGLWSCGSWPYNVWTSTCGSWGLSVGNPFLNDLYGTRFADRVHSIKSWSDQIVCSTGVCTVGGVHSSSIWGENSSTTYALAHYSLLTQTAARQVDLIQ
ncbi:alpha/beta fold hydrolase [Pseudomarimonas salicorniae]|uniref:Lipase family protein n=1 Tax=Pseudomarimonas salicorniae TaxID=2933270 RepID=A0ABT0GJQ9_9GAMM|nr:alpha/beta fold hydrolase [Lysobacter sp. CAU 1642]MCK7594775.1 lipase family protein [Lysobacter sp. CAU 1642]